MADFRLERFAARARQTRQDAGLPLVEVAVRMGISVPYLSQIERGLRLPGLDVVLKLADALEVTPGRLLD